MWTAYRQTNTNPNIPVLWRNASPPGAPPTTQDDGRWNVRGGEYAQYFSLSVDASWAEFIRAQEIRSAAEALRYTRRMWRARVHEERVADLSTPDRAQRCGIDGTVLVGQHEPCQEIARELVAHGFRGVVSPSAALEGELSLTLFGERIDEQLNPFVNFSAQSIDPLIIEVKPFQGPCSPPASVVDKARQKNSAGYSTWPREGDQRPAQAP